MSHLEFYRTPRLAKPGIPEGQPRRREEPDIPYPPLRVPGIPIPRTAPIEPVKTPELIPVK